MTSGIIKRSIWLGMLGALALLAVFFIVVSLISGGKFATSQFTQFWYFIVSLAVGFGVQIGLYGYLKSKIRAKSASGIVAVSGTTSTVAMISCCAHYLANLIPFIGISGAAALIGQYQIEIFWAGLAMNATGIGYIVSRIIKFSENA